MKYRIEKQPQKGIRKGFPAVRKLSLLLMGTALILASSCVKDTLYNTPHPEKGAVTVQLDWSGISPELPAPDSYVLNIDGDEQTVSGTVNTFDQLTEPGSHTLLVYNRPEGISFSGDVASVNEVGRAERAVMGRATADVADIVRIEPMPGYLFASSHTINVQADDTLKLPITPQQYVRLVEMDLKVTEGDYERVTAVVATLGGVERSVNIRTGERLGVPATTRTTFLRGGNRCSGSFRLLGILPSQQQTLTVDLTLSNGETHRIVSDLSGQMKDFNSGIAPLKLTGDLRLPLGGGLEGSIEGWQQADGGNTDAQ